MIPACRANRQKRSMQGSWFHNLDSLLLRRSVRPLSLRPASLRPCLLFLKNRHRAPSLLANSIAPRVTVKPSLTNSTLLTAAPRVAALYPRDRLQFGFSMIRPRNRRDFGRQGPCVCHRRLDLDHPPHGRTVSKAGAWKTGCTSAKANTSHSVLGLCSRAGHSRTPFIISRPEVGVSDPLGSLEPH